jgi:hypothetical protein
MITFPKYPSNLSPLSPYIPSHNIKTHTQTQITNQSAALSLNHRLHSPTPITELFNILTATGADGNEPEDVRRPEQQAAPAPGGAAHSVARNAGPDVAADRAHGSGHTGLDGDDAHDGAHHHRGVVDGGVAHCVVVVHCQGILSGFLYYNLWSATLMNIRF